MHTLLPVVLGAFPVALGASEKYHCYPNSHPDVEATIPRGDSVMDPWDYGGARTHDDLHLLLEPWLGTAINGSAHPDIEALIKQQVPFTYPPSHPNINRICEVGLPAIWLPGWHPQVDAALEAGTPYPANHPKIHDSLSHAMPSSHPDIDELLKSGSFAMPANHCKIDPWVGQSLGYGYSAGFWLCASMGAVFSILVFFRYLSKLCGTSANRRDKDSFTLKHTDLLNIDGGAVELQGMEEGAGEQPSSDDEGSDASVASDLDFPQQEGVQRSKMDIAIQRQRSNRRGGGAALKRLAMDEKARKEGEQVRSPRENWQVQQKGDMKHADAAKLYDHGAYGHKERSGAASAKVRARNLLPKERSPLCLSCWTPCAKCRVCNTQCSGGNVWFVLWYILVNFLCVMLSAVDFDGDYQLNLSLATKALNDGRAWGSIATANLIILIVPATRNSLLMPLAGLSFEYVLIYHRALGRLILLSSLYHAYLFFPTLDLGESVQFTGFLALCCMLAIFLTSLSFVRRKWFQVFYWSHLSFYGLFIFGYMHVSSSGKLLIIIAFGIHALDRVLRIVWTLLPSRTIVFRSKGDQVAQVRFAKKTLPSILGRHEVGQYYLVNIPSVSLVEWHPYFATSSPRENIVELHIRNRGNWTKKVVKRASQLSDQSSLPLIRVDGPYGHLDFNFRRYPVLMLTGGGAGIAPIIGMLKDLYNVGEYSIDQRATVVPHRIHTIYLVWAIKGVEDMAWFREEIDACVHNAQLPQFPRLQVWVYATEATKEEVASEGPPVVEGLPKFDDIMDKISMENKSRATLAFACGHSSLVNAIWDSCIARTSQGTRFDFHKQSFDW